jgi:hypothetical protein
VFDASGTKALRAKADFHVEKHETKHKKNKENQKKKM